MHIFHEKVNTKVPCEPYYVLILFWTVNYPIISFILEVNYHSLLLLKNRQEGKKQILPASWKDNWIYLIKNERKIESEKGEIWKKENFNEQG